MTALWQNCTNGPPQPGRRVPLIVGALLLLLLMLPRSLRRVRWLLVGPVDADVLFLLLLLLFRFVLHSALILPSFLQFVCFVFVIFIMRSYRMGIGRGNLAVRT